MSGFIKEITSVEDFEKEVLGASVPVVVDFWASWCGPCRTFAPIFESVATDYVRKVGFVKVDTDEAQTLAAQYGIRSIPTLIIFKNGRIVEQRVSAMSMNQLRTFVSRHI